MTPSRRAVARSERRKEIPMNRETLGPAERIIQTVLAYSDHMVHNRPGMVVPAPTSVTGLVWSPVTHKEEGGKKVVYRLDKIGKKTVKRPVGELREDRSIVDGTGRRVAEYRPAGLFPEVAAWLYRQVAAVYALDNEFAARWASHAFGEEHRDLKVVLAAFMLVQARKGDPVHDDGKVAFHDDDFRDVGEAMVLLRRKDGRDLNPKLLLRVRDVLVLPEVAKINRELGFGRSARKPFLGRWPRAVEKWLRYREDNLPMLEALVKAGFKKSVKLLSQRIGYKPSTAKFFEVLGWSQAQAADGRRDIAIGQKLTREDTWEGLGEIEVCERIVAERPSFKRIVGMVPKTVGVTRAVMAAAVEARCLSDKDLIIAIPTLEELGILTDPAVAERVERAVRAAEDQRAANVATRVKSAAVREKLEEAADNAIKKAVVEVTRGLRIYFMVDISASMQNSIEQAKVYLEKFLQGFPLDRLHVSVFNTTGREIAIKHASGAGVRNAFHGIAAGGGTDYGAGVRALQGHRPAEGEDALFLFVGDEEAGHFADAVRSSGLAPMAFGLVRVGQSPLRAVSETATHLGIPCFTIDERTFADPYAIPRTVRALVAATPVGKAAQARVSLVDTILETKLLVKPVWASAA
jgi:hypothetical protein